MIGGIVAALVHEGFDFALHTPANALLFTLLLALAMRVAMAEGPAGAMPRIRLAPRVARAPALGAPLGILAALGLLIAVYTQDGAAYPYDVLVADNPRRAEANLTAHPAMSGAHLALGDVLVLSTHGDLRHSATRHPDAACRLRHEEVVDAHSPSPHATSCMGRGSG